MANVNFCIIGGYLARDPELRYTPTGDAVCDFCVAVNKTWFNKQTNQKQQETAFVDCTAWKKLAETVSEHLSKGSSVLVEGNLKQDRWQDKATGANRSKLKVNARLVHFLEKHPKKEEGPTQRPPLPKAEEKGPDTSEIPF